MMAYIKDISKRCDITLLLLTAGVLCVGIISIISATLSFQNQSVFLTKQIAAITIGLILMFLFTFLNYRIFIESYPLLFSLSILLLLFTLFFGKEVRGTKAWLDFGTFSFQTSELAKFIFLISISAYVNKKYDQMTNAKHLLVPAFMLFSYVILILLQGDFSSILVYFPIFLVIMWVSKIKKELFITMVAFVFLVVVFSFLFIWISHFHKQIFINYFKRPFALFIYAITIFGILLIVKKILKSLLINLPNSYFLGIWFLIVMSIFISLFTTNVLKHYQKQRVLVFLSPWVDSTGYGYSLQQAKIAVGSGRIFGKGLFSGTQTQLGFIPEKHTDFIFSAISEEGGFIASSLIIMLCLLILRRCYLISLSTSDRFGKLLALSVFTMIAFSLLYNILMNLGLVPIVGIPLPLLSYGGSNVVITLASLGIVQSVCVRRYWYR